MKHGIKYVREKEKESEKDGDIFGWKTERGEKMTKGERLRE